MCVVDSELTVKYVYMTRHIPLVYSSMEWLLCSLQQGSVWLNQRVISFFFVAYGFSDSAMIQKKRENLTACSFLLAEALELPISVERANLQRPHAEYEYANIETLSRFNIGRINISTRHLPFAASLTEIFEIFQVSTSQERASSKRFLLCLFCIPTHICPRPGLCDVRSALAKLTIIY